MLQETEGTIKNEQSRETGNTGNTRHRTKTNKWKQKTQHKKTQKMSNTDPPRTGNELRIVQW